MLLDKRYITGNVGDNTPHVVVVEVCQSLGIAVDSTKLPLTDYRAKVLRCLGEVQPYKIEQPYNWSVIAQYVNPDKTKKWTREQLSDSLEWLNTGHNSIPLDRDIMKLQVDNPTPESPRNVPPSFLYKWCLLLGGVTSNSMDVQELKVYCYGLRCDRLSLISNICMACNTMNTATLATMWSMMKVESMDPSVHNQRVDILTVTSGLLRIRTGGQSCYPCTFSDAVCMAAKNYNVDLSIAKNPIVEYYRLISGASYTQKNMVDLVTVDPGALSLSINFNPLFPCNFYPKSTLNLIGSKYPIESTTSNNIYQELSEYFMLDNFHLGVIPGVEDFTTSIEMLDLLDKKEREGNIILTYGSKTTTMRLYTVSELTSLFTNNKNFKCPHGGDFSKSCISYLQTMCIRNKKKVPIFRRDNGDDPWDMLRQAISECIMYQSRVTTHEKVLRSRYTNLSTIDKNLVINILTNVLNSGMYMRGWKGDVNNYPLQDTSNTDTRYTDIKSCECLTNYYNLLSKLEDSSIITDLPLLIFSDNEYRVCSNDDEGLTIHGRIFIVQNGDHTTNINSCIRMSSNWLVSSAYKYLQALNHKPNFDIGRLKYVS